MGLVVGLLVVDRFVFRDLRLPLFEVPPQLINEARMRAHELVPRTLISTHHASSLRIIREHEPRLRLGLSVPNIRHDPFRSPALSVPVYGALATYRAVLPFRVTRAIRSRLCDALMAHFRLVTPRLVDSVHRAGGELYVWTVDDVERVRELERLGVDGVISNDPRILQPV